MMQKRLLSSLLIFLMSSLFLLAGCANPGSDTSFIEMLNHSSECIDSGCCGDNKLGIGEECDDGNRAGGDSCSPLCTLEVCGNSIVDKYETCDDGNTYDGDGCDKGCQLGYVYNCGDGTKELGEGCDDGNTIDGDGCAANCQMEVCGNGIINPGEECDDFNTVNGDGCNLACLYETQSPMTLSLNVPINGQFYGTKDNIDYTLDVLAGNKYVISWKSRWDGGGTEKAIIQVTITDNTTQTDIVTDQRYGYSTPVVYVPAADGTLTIHAEASYYTVGTYQLLAELVECGDNAINILTENCEDGNSTSGDGCSDTCLFEAAGAPITLDTWVDGNLINITDEAVYTFQATQGQLYYLHWTELRGANPAYNARIDISLTGNSSGTAYRNYAPYYSLPQPIAFTPVLNEQITIKVQPMTANEYNTGAYKLMIALPVCGDGVVDSYNGIVEECDDGNIIDGDGCNSQCKIAPQNFPMGVWLDGELTDTMFKEIYTFNVIKGESYRIWMIDKDTGTYTQTADVRAKAIYQDSGVDIFGFMNSGWPAPKEFIATQSGAIVLTIDSSNYNYNTGTYQIKIEAGQCGDGYFDLNETCEDSNTINGDGCNDTCKIESQTIPLGTWHSDSLTANIPKDIYLIQGSLGDSYRITWNNRYSGDGTQTAWLNVTATDKVSQTDYFTNEISGWTAPWEISAISDGLIILKVKPNFSSGIGTYQIKIELAQCGDGFLDLNESCDDGNTNNGDGCSSTCSYEPQVSQFGVWYSDDIVSSIPGDIYRYSVTAEEMYRVYWNDFYAGDGTQTANIKVSATDLTSGSNYFWDVNHSWSVPQYFIAANTGQVDLSVFPFYSGNTGTYQILAEVVACGDGKLDMYEQCDDGNAASSDGCSDLCVLEGSLRDIPGMWLKDVPAGTPNSIDIYYRMDIATSGSVNLSYASSELAYLEIRTLTNEFIAGGGIYDETILKTLSPGSYLIVLRKRVSGNGRFTLHVSGANVSSVTFH